MKQSVRSQSGVCVISIATDGFNNITCNFDCSFCPSECKERGAKLDISRSYLSSEGTFQRGLVDNFQPTHQIWRRISELEAMGHYPDKFEIIVLGGTWDCMPAIYRTNLIHDIFYACNTYPSFSNILNGPFSNSLKEWYEKKPFLNKLPFFSPEEFLRNKKSFEEEKCINEGLDACRIIGIVLETRPDMISKYNCLNLRKLGCTRVQLGIQHTNDYVLSMNNRGHGVEQSIKAITILKENCFKVDGHMMPDLPFTTLQHDYQLANEFFLSKEFQLDYVKIYPCLRLPYTLAEKWYEQGIWNPIAEHDYEGFMEYLEYCLSIVPPWTRINRVQRDFPTATEKNQGLGFTSPTIKVNLHQLVTDRMAKKGLKCYDIRSREVKKDVVEYENARLYIRKYTANGGTEYFISVEVPKSKEDLDDCYLLGLLRLRLSEVTQSNLLLKTFREKIAKIREVHVYGYTYGSKDINIVQHKGIGKFLLKVAENISIEHGYNKIAVISGVGVRNYYRSQGYTITSIDGEYLIKELKNKHNLVLFDKVYTLNYDIKKEYKAADGKLFIIEGTKQINYIYFYLFCILLFVSFIGIFCSR
jgi:ELP3 family radical SAM enzyme/protein acetyltransferase